MNLFLSLGLAVVGIFTTVVLVGVLAGVIAFGLIERGLRRQAQERIVRKLVDEPIRLETLDQNRVGDPAVQTREDLGWLRDLTYGGNILAQLLRLDPDRLYSLPYRQLCGQVANAISSEFAADGEETPFASFQPVTVALSIAERASNPNRSVVLLTATQTPQRLAMQFLDTLQIALSNAVLATARHCAGWAILFLLAVSIAPGMAALNIFSGDPSIALRTIGGIFGITIAVILVMALAFAASIISEMTFRWMDRSATAR